MSQAAHKSRTPLITFLIVLGFLFWVILKMIAPYGLALFLGGTLALLSYPLYGKLRRKIPAIPAGILVTLGVFLLVIGPLVAFAVRAVQQGVTLGTKLADEGISVRKLENQVTKSQPVREIVKTIPDFRQQLTQGVQTAAKASVAYVLKLVKTIPQLLLHLSLAALTCFFFLLDGKRCWDWFLNKIPLEEDIRAKLVKSFTATTVSTVWAGFAAAGSQAVAMFAGFLVLGIPGAFLAGGFTFVLAWIPVLGSMPTAAAGVIYLYVQQEFVKMAIMIVIAVLTGILDNIMRVWVLKGREEMHPFIGLVAVIAGIDMFGIFGVFVGPILVAILISLLELWPDIGERFGLTQGTRAELT
jgi:predicted PurR-regulated permease PerM